VAVSAPFYRKGIGLIFPNQDVDVEWQHKQSRGRLRGPRREFSFLVNKCTDPGIGLTGDRVGGWERRLLLDRFGAPSTLLENLAACLIRTPGRTHHRIRSPRLAASSR
jgi:hypothetical protein